MVFGQYRGLPVNQRQRQSIIGFAMRATNSVDLSGHEPLVSVPVRVRSDSTSETISDIVSPSHLLLAGADNIESCL